MSAIEKLEEIKNKRKLLDQEELELIKKRKDEIVAIIEKLGILHLDNELIAGALIAVGNAYLKKDEAALDSFRRSGANFRTKKQNATRSKKAS